MKLFGEKKKSHIYQNISFIKILFYLDVHKNVKAVTEKSKQISSVASLVSLEGLYLFNIDYRVKIWELSSF